MLRFFRMVSKRGKGIRIAEAITPLLLTSSRLCFVSVEKRARILDLLVKDDSVLSLFYGAIARCVSQYGLKDTGTVGFALWETFERLFPGRGRDVLDRCNQRLEENDKVFAQGVRSGSQEMDAVINAGGKVPLISIQLRVDELEREM